MSKLNKRQLKKEDEVKELKDNFSSVKLQLDQLTSLIANLDTKLDIAIQTKLITVEDKVKEAKDEAKNAWQDVEKKLEDKVKLLTINMDKRDNVVSSKIKEKHEID